MLNLSIVVTTTSATDRRPTTNEHVDDDSVTTRPNGGPGDDVCDGVIVAEAVTVGVAVLVGAMAAMAYTRASSDEIYTVPSAPSAGDAEMPAPVAKFHSGVPEAFHAYSRPSSQPTNTLPFTSTAGDDCIAVAAATDQRKVPLAAVNAYRRLSVDATMTTLW